MRSDWAPFGPYEIHLRFFRGFVSHKFGEKNFFATLYFWALLRYSLGFVLFHCFFNRAPLRRTVTVNWIPAQSEAGQE